MTSCLTVSESMAGGILIVSLALVLCRAIGEKQSGKMVTMAVDGGSS